MNGIERIAKERKRQIEEEGWTLARDREVHLFGRLAVAAGCYALMSDPTPGIQAIARFLWPWDQMWWKPGEPGNTSASIRRLEKAGALIAAEIDRLLRPGEGT